MMQAAIRSADFGYIPTMLSQGHSEREDATRIAEFFQATMVRKGRSEKPAVGDLKNFLQIVADTAKTRIGPETSYGR